MGCLSDEALLSFARGMLPSHERAMAERHVDVCVECRTAIAELAIAEPQPMLEAGAVGPEEPPGAALRPGTLVSRYIVTRVVGAGRGGVVYEARDPQLDRRVGLKLLRL